VGLAAGRAEAVGPPLIRRLRDKKKTGRTEIMDEFPPAARPARPVIEPPRSWSIRWQLEVLELRAHPDWRGNDMHPNVYRHLAGWSAQGREVG
jgi:hypothetical protein